MTSDLTPWFIGAEDLPVMEREGRYQARFCVGWRAVPVDWRNGKFWIPRGPFDKPEPVKLKQWPGFQWRGLCRNNAALRGEPAERP